MANNFFRQQDTARRNTSRLVILFAIALICITALVYGLILVLFSFESIEYYPGSKQFSWWQPELLGLTMLGVGSTVGLASLYKVSQLSSGGDAVAMMMGCTEVPANTRDLREKRLLNIVEEMAIASGVPVPPVYVMEEEGINAFAAGYAPGDAVVAVSRGCLNYLNRDELQGVVAHEFSHILNGDMRLNVRLIGLIFGIMALAVIGRILLHAGSRRSYSSKNDGRGGILLLGLGLLVLGAIGAFFGRLIQSAVSRQREFLADASAVQFTRNPDGIAGALKKIGGLQAGSKIENPEAAEIGHMFFASSLQAGFASLFATHPPLVERIRRIEPTFDGTFPKVVRPVAVSPIEAQGPRPDRVPGGGGLKLPGFPQVPLPVPVILAEQVADRVGSVLPPEIHQAQVLADEFPAELRAASEEPFAARALVYSLLLDPRPEVREQQVAKLRAGAPVQDYQQTMSLADAVQALPDRQRLPLLDLAMPSLRQMSRRQHAEFRQTVEELIKADQRVSLFEYALRCVLHRHLDAQFRPESAQRTPPTRRPNESVVTVLAMLAWHGDPNPRDPKAAFEAGTRKFFGDAGGWRPPEKLSLAEFDAALLSLRWAKPDFKRRLIEACVECILADGNVAVREVELLRAICDMLDCPMPLLVPSA